jgi:hypothetical protein
MARQHLGPKKVRQLRVKTGLPVHAALVRGGTEHRIDLWLADGRIVRLWPDGSLEPTESTWDQLSAPATDGGQGVEGTV